MVGEERTPNHLFIIMSSDRGLCGSVHSNLARTVRSVMEQRDPNTQTSFVCYGDKVRTLLPSLLSHTLLHPFGPSLLFLAPPSLSYYTLLCHYPRPPSLPSPSPHRYVLSYSVLRGRTFCSLSTRWGRSLRCLLRPQPWPTQSSALEWSMTRWRYSTTNSSEPTTLSGHVTSRLGHMKIHVHSAPLKREWK